MALAASSCYGYSIERVDAHTLVENRGGVRYVYRSTQLVTATARGPAAPALAVAPSGAREVGLIEARIEFGGASAEGVRDSEASFYPQLAALAGQMGGTHFLVLRSTHVTSGGVGDFIASLTVDVLDASER